MLKNCERLYKHRAISFLIVIFSSMFLTYPFYPLRDAGLYIWLVKSLQMMGGVTVFAFYGFVEGYIAEVVDIVLLGVILPVVCFVIHIWKKSLLALYAGVFFWVIAGFATVIVAHV